MNAFSPFSCDMAGLPTVDEVTALLRRRFASLSSSEEAQLAHARGRILAADIAAHLTVPPYDRSAMDGYAYRDCDAGPLRLVGRAPAGKPFGGVVGAGECVAIATGGALPPGCDSVAMHEHCRVTAGGVVIAGKRKGANVRRRGEDFHIGDTLLAAGTRVTPRHTGLLAAAGVRSVAVRPRPRIALFSIGDELNENGPGGIVDANRPMLRALCAEQGLQVTDLGILPDNCDQITAALRKAAPHHDAILCSAGSCTGEEDHARSALLLAGGDLMAAGVAIKPGKPVSFGSLSGKPCILLPGNPAAAYIVFLILGLPLLRHLSGAAASGSSWQQARASFTHRKKPGIREFIRIRLERTQGGTLLAEKMGHDGSAMLCSLAASEALASLPEQITEVREGDVIAVASFAALEAP